MGKRPKLDAEKPAPAEQPPLSQLDKFKAAARELGTDDDPERFKERVKRIGAAKPAEALSGGKMADPR